MCAGNQRMTSVAVAAVPEANSGLAIGSPTGVSAGAPTALGAKLNSEFGAEDAENAEDAEKGEV